MTPSPSIVMPFSRLLAVAYLGAAAWLFASYWLSWERPILRPLAATWTRHLGDVEALPLGEAWTRRYTQGIRQSAGAGLIEANALVFLPFPASTPPRKLEIELRSLFVSPGYRTEVTILINDKRAARVPVGHGWQTIEVDYQGSSGLGPPNLKLQFNMEKVGAVPRYSQAEVLRFEPDADGFSIWRSGTWEPGNAQSLDAPVRLERSGNAVTVGEERLTVEQWPLTVALAPWDSPRLRHPHLAVELPTVACRTIRIR